MISNVNGFYDFDDFDFEISMYMYVIIIWGGFGNIFNMMVYCYYVFFYRCIVFLLFGFFLV